MSAPAVLNTLIYARVSTVEQGENYSLPTQIEGCRAWAAAHGYTVAGVVRDTHTGEALERPGVASLLAQVRAGAAQVVVVYDLDRFTRDPEHLAILEYEIEEAGGRVEYVLGNFAATPEGRLSKAVKAAIAQYENEQRRERIRRGKRGRAAAGFVVPKAQPPFGYRYVRAGDHQGRLEVEEAQAEVVRRMFGWAAAGETVHGIATRLGEEGVPSPTGGRWPPTTVRRILRNEVYRGVWQHNTRGVERQPGRKPKAVKLPPEQWIPVPTPALVDADLWRQVQERLDTSAARSREAPRAFLLAGHVVCACGRRWEGRTRSESLRYYRCPTIKERRWREPCPLAGNIRAEALETAVWEAVERLLLDPELLEAELKRRAAGAEAARADLDKQMRALTAQANRLEREAGMLLDRLLEGELTAEETAAEKRRLDAEREGILGKRDALRAARNEVPPQGAGDLRSLGQALRSAMADLSFEGRRKTLALLQARVDVVSITERGSEVRLTTVLGLPPATLALPPGRRTRQLRKAQEDRSQ